MERTSASLLIVMALISGQASACTESTGSNGILSSGLGLTGAGIGIGQVEVFRPGVPGTDSAANSNPTVVPSGVFVQNLAATANMNIDSHAEEVAGVMISTDMVDSDTDGDIPVGVANGASLFSSATNVPVLPGQPEAALSAQHVATRNGGDVRAINFSFGEGLTGGDILDGNSLLTQFVDWSASEHDTLYVIAGNEGGGTIPIPTDNYNGMTVAYSRKNGGVFREVDPDNLFTEDAVGNQTTTDILAPGRDIELAGLGGSETDNSGTSFAAPHVTGTVALLQEFGDGRISAGASNWDTDARRHEVMKAVLMNSADKLIDNGTVTVPGGLPIPTGGLLGMDRTVIKSDGSSTWFDSISWDDSVDSSSGGFFSLDDEMGTGHLNAKRALEQFATGEHEEFGVSGARVPVIGWDYGTTSGDNDVNRYRFNQELEAGSFVSITLAWDREVVFDTDGGTPGVYDIGDTFQDFIDPGFGFPAADVINDMELYFQPAFAGNVFQARAFSTSFDNLQHIFFQVETTGEFEFWVRQTDEDVSVTQDYAVAWWASGTGPLIAGDFDGDGDVDGADLVQWESDYGINATSDANGDGRSDGLDFLAWQRNVGFGTLSNVAAVPEPSTALVLLIGMSVVAPLRVRPAASI